MKRVAPQTRTCDRPFEGVLTLGPHPPTSAHANIWSNLVLNYAKLPIHQFMPKSNIFGASLVPSALQINPKLAEL